MKNFLTLYLILISISSIFGQSAVCPCTPSTQIVNQDRTDAKHVTGYNKFVMKKDTITVKYIYSWQQKYNALTSQITRKDKVDKLTKKTIPTSQRKHGTPEDTLYLLKGFMWYVKQEPNTNHGDAHTKLYSWELHPLRDVVFLKGL